MGEEEDSQISVGADLLNVGDARADHAVHRLEAAVHHAESDVGTHAGHGIGAGFSRDQGRRVDFPQVLDECELGGAIDTTATPLGMNRRVADLDQHHLWVIVGHRQTRYLANGDADDLRARGLTGDHHVCAGDHAVDRRSVQGAQVALELRSVHLHDLVDFFDRGIREDFGRDLRVDVRGAATFCISNEFVFLLLHVSGLATAHQRRTVVGRPLDPRVTHDRHEHLSSQRGTVPRDVRVSGRLLRGQDSQVQTGTLAVHDRTDGVQQVRVHGAFAQVGRDPSLHPIVDMIVFEHADRSDRHGHDGRHGRTSFFSHVHGFSTVLTVFSGQCR